MSKPFLSKVYTEPNSLCSNVTQWKSEGKKVVFTNGCFDILHIGHASYLEEAKQQGDILIVGVNDDLSVSRLKGPTRPINSIADRMALLAALESVDAV
ncbi:MAG: adenylyltransferase/cytidyltransferase family protein, partial [Saprospiraceae bacterium]